MASRARKAPEGERPVPQLEDVVGQFRSRYKTLGETVLDVLRQSILQGVFEPGQHLRQEELAERIGVSRIPVRSALMQLDAEGLVVFQPHRGATVRSMSADRLRETYRLRILLETYALRTAAEALSAEDKKEIVAEGIRLDKAHEGSEFYNDRVEFYRRLYGGERNPVTVEIVEQLRVSVGRYRLGLRMRQHGFSHEALARAVQKGALAKAEEMLREHLQSVCDELIASIPVDGAE
jgi:DNA-binding GntR family transcriptional regulator